LTAQIKEEMLVKIKITNKSPAPVAHTIHIQDKRSVGDSVKDRGSKAFIMEDLDPVGEREIRSNERTRGLVPGGQELE